MKKLLFSPKFWLVAGAVVLLGWGVRGIEKRKWGRKTNGKVKMVTVSRKNLQKILALSGRVEAEEKATLRFQTSGLLSWVGVKEGDWVKKGQAIASLDKRELKKTLAKKMNDYLKYRWDWEQGREDYEVDQRWFELSDTVKRILEKNQFDLNKAVLDVELADLAVRLATITAPFGGIVTKVESPWAGVNITPASAEFGLVNPASVYFYAEADEEEVTELQEGMSTRVFLDAYPQRVWPGTIRQVNFAPVSTSGSPTYAVKIDFLDLDNQDLKLRLRMEGEAEIVVAAKEKALVIPSEAVLGEEKFFVWVMSERGEKQKRFVKVGLETDEETEILEGLQEGEKVLVE